MLAQSDLYTTITLDIRQEDLIKVHFELANGFHKYRHLEFYWFDDSVTSSTWEQRRERFIFFTTVLKARVSCPRFRTSPDYLESFSPFNSVYFKVFFLKEIQMNAASGCLNCLSLSGRTSHHPQEQSHYQIIQPGGGPCALWIKRLFSEFLPNVFTAVYK